MRALLPLLLCVGLLAALIPAAAGGAPPTDVPDPMDRGPYAPERLEPFKAGLFSYQEPNAGGGAATGNSEPVTFQIRGQAFVPANKPGKSPIIILVHGNHGSCDTSGTAPNCAVYKRNDAGYAYLSENLATWGYSVFSIDQDQLMLRQDGIGKGMHARRAYITALLDSLYKANEVGLPTEAQDSNFNIGKSLVAKLDFTRIGLMGHSRGGDVVSSFVDGNRMRPSGRRYPLRGVISLAPVNYERSATYGVPFMSILPWCDGDVSNLQGARIYERSQHVRGTNPYPTIQSSQLGGNHNFYNTVWFADSNPDTGNGDDASAQDPACNQFSPKSIRLSGQAGRDISENYVINNGEAPGLANKLDPTVNTRISGDPVRMGDQEKIGLATMSAFFRRYVGGEGAMEPYLTGELSEVGKPQIPTSACPTSPTGKNMPCIERVSNSYFAPSSERLDVIGPESESPLALSALGTKLVSSGFSNPYQGSGGVTPLPPTTGSGLAWCNPEPDHSQPTQVGFPNGTRPKAVKACPMPADGGLGGQAGVREQAPVNNSYGRQFAIAWEDPLTANGAPAKLGTTIPAAQQDVSEYKALAMGADVNFFDSRNPARTEAAWSDPSLTTQDFTIALTDAEGREAAVSAADPRYGNALHQTTSNTSARVHVILDEIRVPLSDFAEQGVDLTEVRKLELRFGEAGKPASGSIELADIRFQELVDGTDVLLDSTEPNAGPGEGPPTEGPNPVTEMQEFDRSPLGLQLPDVTMIGGSNVWTVDDDKVQCPSAGFTSVQAAIDMAAPWDTIVICPGLYEESSTPLTGPNSPSQAGSKNGLTITKPLKIKGAGADQVTIRPASSLSTLAGTAPYLRDGGGNVVTISRQSFGSTEDIEMFVDISGVTIESPSTYAEAGVAFFDSAGRISDSVVGPLKAATTESELAEKPHGWGIVATNHLIGSGPGTVLRRITVDDSKVFGYQSGGILFDDARGTDGAPANTEPSGIRIAGYVDDTIVEGMGANPLVPQTGIQYHAGAYGFIESTKVSGNMFPTDQRKSAGILLTGADTSNWYVKGSLLAGNGYGLFNANIANAKTSEGPAALATGNHWGNENNGAAIEGPTVVEGTKIKEGVSPKWGEPTPTTASVTFSGPLTTAPAIAAPGAITDLSPVGEIVNPGDGEEVDAAVPTEVAVKADDDFGITSVSLKADGTPVASVSTSPYTFSWTPSPADRGDTVTLEATITDSSGKTTTAELDVEITPQALPVVSNEPVGTITKTTAVLHGKVDNEDDGDGSTCSFEVAKATDLTFLDPVDTVDCTPNPVTGSAATDVTATAEDLNAGTAYIYRVVATNDGGTSKGTPAVEFTTEAPQAQPVVSNEPVGAVTKTAAVLKGKVDNEGDAAGSTCSFEVTTAGDATFADLVDTVACTPNPVTGSAATDVTATVEDLNAGAAYIYRVVASNEGGTSKGTPAAEFKTDAEPKKEEPKKEDPKVEPPAPAPVVDPPATGKITKDTEKGTAQLKITAPGAGTITVSGEGVKKVTRTVTGPVTIQSPVKAKGKKLRTLNRKGKVTVKVKVAFTAPNGTVTTTTRTLTLVKE